METKTLTRILLSLDKIADEDGQFSFADLASSLGVSKARISVLMDELVELGYLERYSKRLVKIQSKGKEAIANRCREVEALTSLLQERLGLDENLALEAALSLPASVEDNLRNK